MGSHTLLQGIFPTQVLNPGLPHCRQILYPLSHPGSPRILEWVAYPFSGDIPDSGIELGSPALQADSLPAELPGKPLVSVNSLKSFLCLKSFSGLSLSPGEKKVKLVYIGYKTPCDLLPRYLFWLISLAAFRISPYLSAAQNAQCVFVCMCILFILPEFSEFLEVIVCCFFITGKLAFTV